MSSESSSFNLFFNWGYVSLVIWVTWALHFGNCGISQRIESHTRKVLNSMSRRETGVLRNLVYFHVCVRIFDNEGT